jgi:hypothetical protein
MTYDTGTLAKLGKEHRKAKATLERIRAQLAEEIVSANKGGVPQHEIVSLSDYTRESVRLLCLTPEQKEAERQKRRKPSAS